MLTGGMTPTVNICILQFYRPSVTPGPGLVPGFGTFATICYDSAKSRVIIIQLYRPLLHRPVIIQVGHKNERLAVHHHCLSAFSGKTKTQSEMWRKCRADTFSSSFCHFQNLHPASFEILRFVHMHVNQKTNPPLTFCVHTSGGSLTKANFHQFVKATSEKSRTFSGFQLVPVKVLDLAVKCRSLCKHSSSRS